MHNHCNLTRPCQALNLYVSIERYKNHLQYLIGIANKIIQDKKCPQHLFIVMEEVRWTKLQLKSFRLLALVSEEQSFAYGMPS